MAQSKTSSKCGFRQHHCRKRLCLLKGCETWFRPRCALCRYCSESCRDAARRWSVRRAEKRYRQSTKGKEKRQQQHRSYRKRRKLREQIGGKNESSAESEGDHRDKICEGVLCARPGCYERVIPMRRSPLKKYCSFPCRRAFRRVLEREKRWKERLRELLEFDYAKTLIP